MDDSQLIEEDVTRSNFAFLTNHNLDIRGSMGLFPDRSDVQDISAIDPHDTTQHFLHSKSSAASVFDRLVQDTNRRNFASKKVSDYRLMLELEYENSFLSQAKINRTTEVELVSRLMQDSDRRMKNIETITNFKKTQESVRSEVKWPAEKTMQVVNRLSVDKRESVMKRESVRKGIVEQEVEIFKKIREQRHPRREIDQERMKRITASSSPVCKHSKAREVSCKSFRNKQEMEKAVDRLHKKSPLKLMIPYKFVEENTGASTERIRNTRKKLNMDADDYIMKLKASGRWNNIRIK